MNADPLVGLHQDGHKNYSAAQNTKVNFDSERRLRFRKRPMSDYCSLFTEGFILTKIDTVAEPARLGAIPQTWTKVAGWQNAVDGHTDPPVEFWRTLVADRGKGDRNPPYYYATTCRESVRKGGLRGGSVDTAALISSKRNSTIAEFCWRVQAVIWNSCLIKTDEPLNVLGLASQHVRKGDLVCIVFGCTVPIILRRAEKPSGDLEKEKMQDNIEAMKAAMAVCEEACFRKLRYQKRLQKERESNSLCKEEVLAELKEVYNQISEWVLREQEDKKRKRAQDKNQKIRKEHASKRRESMAKLRRHAKLQPLQKSSTMPRLGSMAMEDTPRMGSEALSDTKSNLYRFCTDHDQVSDIYATVSLADQVPDYFQGYDE
ncbi:putative heterokaryon incompatibility [Diaporthe ampelina]|uniref:Putative heterokaryon incompatibility n=1 Tax=Diaporthe ampelina TaxID=1214573 RepID=A0A0G2FWA6_9PEZI|nr:putative heterokaryon incompatibility [Diaporthe ampelina]